MTIGGMLEARGPRSVAMTLSLVVVLVLASGCGGGDDSEPAEKASTGATVADPVAAAEDSLERQKRYIFAYGKREEFEPQPRFPSGSPPEELETTDFREGTGKQVEHGDRAVVNYVGYHFDTKKKYDTSYGSNPVPYEVVPGRDDFIEGFEEGIVGMKVGGIRQVIIPPDMGYGDEGYNNGEVDPGETLVFVIDLERVEKP